MSALASLSLLLGLLAVMCGGLSLLFPAPVRAGLVKFPRSVWPGRILLAVDMVWSAWAVNQMHFGGFDSAKVHLYWLAPVCIVLGCLYLEELLSVRALGGLLLLAAGPMLNVARFHPSAWRLVIPVLAYVWIIVGLFFLLCPWWFRRMTERVRSDTAMRAWGAIRVLAGAGLIALALLVY